MENPINMDDLGGKKPHLLFGNQHPYIWLNKNPHFAIENLHLRTSIRGPPPFFSQEASSTKFTAETEAEVSEMAKPDNWAVNMGC